MSREVSGELPELRSIRFPFGFLIVIYHYTNYFADYEQSGWVILEDLAFVLDCFFILSGFVMAHVYARLPALDYGKYINRRLFRIYPLHLLTFLSLVVIAIVGTASGYQATNPERYDFDTALLHLTMVHAWFFDPVITFNVPSWSVSAEWFVYLLFPLFFIMGRNVRPGLLLLAAIGLAGLWYVGTLITTGYSYPNLEGFAIIRSFVDFFIGYALRLYLSKRSLPFTRFRHASRYYAAFLGLSGLIGFPPVLSIGVFLLYCGAAYERVLEGREDGAFDNHAFNRLGDAAFALYITHMPVAIYATNIIEILTGLSLPGPSNNPAVVAAFVFILVLSVIVAWLVHNVIEQPCAIYGPRLAAAFGKRFRRTTR